MASKDNTDQGHKGHVKDPEHDGRLKENRERGETKGTTEASARRAEEAGHEPSGGGRKAASEHEEAGHKASPGSDQDQEQGQDQAGSSDLKEREYRDQEGNIHHIPRNTWSSTRAKSSQKGKPAKTAAKRQHPLLAKTSLAEVAPLPSISFC